MTSALRPNKTYMLSNTHTVTSVSLGLVFGVKVLLTLGAVEHI
jgi:hypothetical protein